MLRRVATTLGTQVAKSNEFTLKSHQQIFHFASSSTSSYADKNVDVFATSTKSADSTIEDKLNNIDNEIITQIKIHNLKLESDELIQQYEKSERLKRTNYWDVYSFDLELGDNEGYYSL